MLVVDDSAMMRTVIKRAATLTGVPIGVLHEAQHGRQALEILEAHEVDAVITDINMPVMNGIELLREMASRQQWAHVARIVVSTDGSDARRTETSGLCVRLHVEKPFRPEAMRDVFVELARVG